VINMLWNLLHGVSVGGAAEGWTTTSDFNNVTVF
jgi:hypothetical protein